jgi:hypothetical protein
VVASDAVVVSLMRLAAEWGGLAWSLLAIAVLWSAADFRDRITSVPHRACASCSELRAVLGAIRPGWRVLAYAVLGVWYQIDVAIEAVRARLRPPHVCEAWTSEYSARRRGRPPARRRARRRPGAAARESGSRVRARYTTGAASWRAAART